MLKIVRFVIVAICILLGLVGLILPILPGWLFFGVAALILFPDTAIARKLTAKLSARVPVIGRLFDSLRGQRRE